jgi:hypothetical protein
VAIDLAVADFEVVILGVVTVGVVTVGVVKPVTVTVCHPVQFPALSLTRISTEVTADFRIPLDETDKDRSTKGIDILLA